MLLFFIVLSEAVLFTLTDALDIGAVHIDCLLYTSDVYKRQEICQPIADVLTFIVSLPFLLAFLKQLNRMDDAEKAKAQS